MEEKKQNILKGWIKNFKWKFGKKYKSPDSTVSSCNQCAEEMPLGKYYKENQYIQFNFIPTSQNTPTFTSLLQKDKLVV